MIDVDQVRDAVEQRVLSTVLRDGEQLRRSVFPAMFFTDSARSPVHLEVAVNTASSEAIGDRQRPGATVLVRSQLDVMIAFQLPSREPELGAVLRLEWDVIRRALSRDDEYPADFQVLWKRSSRAPLGTPGWVLVTITLDALHYSAV